ncbi:MAG TPA: hypothetical protein VFP59_19805 [Candidatus Angelobacter sp.]|nr:hypothetical protein [Candidatus Angelobacter sp.]
MSRVWRTIKGYVFWTYERGSFHYDVMVTVILLFIFIAPRFINFKDQPAEHVTHQNSIVITPDGNRGFIYQVDASAVDAQDDDMVKVNVVRLLRPLTGPVRVEKLQAVRDSAGHIVAYRAWIRR